MATSAFLSPLLVVTATLLLALYPPGTASHPFVLIDAGNFNTLDSGDEVMSSAAAKELSLNFIATESKASAASAAYPGDEQMWDFSDAGWEGEEDLDEVEDVEEVEDLEAAGAEVQETVFAPNASVDGQVETATLDALLDFALQALAYEIAKNKSSEMPVPDFNKDFHSRVGPFKVHGHFAASRGTVGDLTSLFRDGAVGVRSEPQGKLVLDAAVGLRLLRVRFQHYSARAGPIRVSGTMEAQVSPATVRAQLVLSPPCSVALRSLAVARVGPLNLRLTGLGALKRLLPLIRRWIEKRVRQDAERLVVQRLSQLIRNALNKISCH